MAKPQLAVVFIAVAITDALEGTSPPIRKHSFADQAGTDAIADEESKFVAAAAFVEKSPVRKNTFKETVGADGNAQMIDERRLPVPKKKKKKESESIEVRSDGNVAMADAENMQASQAALLAEDASTNSTLLAPRNWCGKGIRNIHGNVCCKRSCSQCGGKGCDRQQGCCTNQIQNDGRDCTNEVDVDCNIGWNQLSPVPCSSAYGCSLKDSAGNKGLTVDMYCRRNTYLTAKLEAGCKQNLEPCQTIQSNGKAITFKCNEYKETIMCNSCTARGSTCKNDCWIARVRSSE